MGEKLSKEELKKLSASKFAYRLSELIDSLDYVLFCVLLFISAEATKSQDYFADFVYNQINDPTRRIIASTFNAIVYESLQLLFTMNKKLVHSFTPYLLSIITFINNFIYFRVWETSNRIEMIAKLFISLFFAWASFRLTELYVRRWFGVKFKMGKGRVFRKLNKWKDDLNRDQGALDKKKQEVETEKQDLSTEKQHIEAEKQQIANQKKEIANKEQKLKNEKQEIGKVEEVVRSAQVRVSTLEAEESTLIATVGEIKEWIKQHSCPDCGQALHSTSAKSIKAHKPYCKGKTEIKNRQ